MQSRRPTHSLPLRGVNCLHGVFGLAKRLPCLGFTDSHPTPYRRVELLPRSFTAMQMVDVPTTSSFHPIKPTKLFGSMLNFAIHICHGTKKRIATKRRARRRSNIKTTELKGWLAENGCSRAMYIQLAFEKKIAIVAILPLY